MTVTNQGVSKQHVELTGRTLGSDEHVQTGAVTLTDGVNPTVIDWRSLPSNYSTFRFSVPDGEDRLTAEISVSPMYAPPCPAPGPG